jgi:subtilisin family serine protease
MSQRILRETFGAHARRMVGLGVLLTQLSVSYIAAQVRRPPAPPQRPTVETEIYIVRFRPGTSASEKAAVVQGAGATLRASFNISNAVSVQVQNDTVLARLRNHPRVLGVFANRFIALDQGRGGGNGGSGGGGGSTSKPKPPTGLSATAISSSAISLAWTDAANNENGFTIERCTGSGCSNFTVLVQVGANATSYTNSGLAASTTHRYRVLAYNAAGNSKYSNIAEATTQAPPPPTPPVAPSGLTLQVVSSSQINLSWVDASSNESGFRIERCVGPVATCSGGSFVQIAEVGPNVTGYSNTSLAPETAYTYRVRAYNAAGNSAFSTPAGATTLAAPPGTQVVPAGVERIGAAPGMMTWTGAGVGVAVVDTGLNFSHPDLGLVPEVVGVNSFNAFHPSESCEDIYGHGTHVAGIVAARNNTVGVVGVAPEATLYCVNVFQPDPIYEVTATDESLIAGLEWIAAHANQVNPPIRVVNMSLGRPRTPEDTPDHPMHVIVKALYDSGISVVVSAGNDALREVSQEIPASYPEVMAVASTTAADGLNGYDDFFVPCTGEQSILADTASYFTTDGRFVGGTGVTVSAPGESREDIYDYLGSCNLEPIGILSTWPGGDTIELYGTSMAAPHVAGVLALMWQKELGLGLSLAPETARTRIRGSVDRWGTAPLDSPLVEYSYDGEKEGVIWAPAAVGDVPPPPPDLAPTVSINSPANGSTFNSGASINFAGTASDPEDGNISSALVWTSSRDGQISTGASFSRTLSGGVHTITATVTDSGGNVVRSSVTITVGSPTTPTSVQVTSIVYWMQGTNLLFNVELDNEFGGPVAGANVSVQLYEWLWGTGPWNSTGTTNSQGIVQFQLPNAPWGCYVTQVTNVVATGLTWNGVTPDNYFCN